MTSRDVSFVVPVLDEERTLPGLLDDLARRFPRAEVVVVDGGSRDATVAIARHHASAPLVLSTPSGRAMQMNAGALVARGSAVVFLHADTRLPDHADDLVCVALADPAVVGGNFALRFDGGLFGVILGAVYAIQRRFGVFYGDSCIWARADGFRSLGGFRSIPIMEDYDIARRLRRVGPTPCLRPSAVTSSRRWRRMGIRSTVKAWLYIRWRYVAGVSPTRLTRRYRPVR